MLERQFHDAIVAARTGSEADELARQLWRAHCEGLLTDTEAKTLSEAIASRRASFSGNLVSGTERSPKVTSGQPRASRRISGHRREKMFGPGRPRALDRNAKVRIMHLARCLSRRTEKGRAYGVVTAKALAVLEAILWAYHNSKSGLCFPSYEKIAEAAGCARSTVAEAIKALEDARILSWVRGSSGCVSVAAISWATTDGAGG